MHDKLAKEVKILAVEDDAGDFGLIRVYLRLAGYGLDLTQDTVSWATTLAEARKQANRSKPDIVLLDLSLPDSSGVDTVIAMRKQLPGVPIIVLSGNADKKAAIAALEEGAQDYVVKGHFEHDALGKAVTHALIRAKLEGRLADSEFRWKFAIEGSGDGLWDWNVAGSTVFYSRRWKEMLGYSEDEVGNGLDEWAKRIHPDDEADTTATVQAYLDGKTSIYLSEHRVCCKNGEYKWILDRGMVVSRDEDGKPLRLIGTHTDITERKLMDEQVKQLAFYDTLTNLPNRRLLNDRLSQAMSAGKRSGLFGALMFLDLDNFKPINDTHGHGVGDLLLIEAADRLKSCVREMDTVARFGGDEFVVMLSELDVDKTESYSQVGIVAEKIRATLSEPYLISIKHDGQPDIHVEHHCTASIGVVLFLGHEVCQDDLIEWADAAMYQAKEGGRNQIRFYDDK